MNWCFVVEKLRAISTLRLYSAVRGVRFLPKTHRQRVADVLSTSAMRVIRQCSRAS